MASNRPIPPGLESITSDLGPHSTLLSYLPLDMVISKHQGDFKESFPKAIMFGKLKRNGNGVWVYWGKQSRRIYFRSHYSNKRADRWLEEEDVLSLAIPNDAFRFATTSNRIRALAIYYFMEGGIGDNEDFQFPPTDREALLAVCERYKELQHPNDTSRSQSIYDSLKASVNRIDPARITSAMNSPPRPRKTINCLDPPQSSDTPNKNATVTSQALASTPIDRYLSYEDQEHTIEQDLERISIRSRALVAEIDKAQTELDQCRAEDKRLNTRKEMVARKKKRTWEAMSKEESRELGRREAEVKRHRTQ